MNRAVSSDPLIKASIKGFTTQQTKSISKNLDPVWNEELIFPGVTDPSLSLQITVEDYDLTKNDFMGRIIIPLYQFERMVPTRKWYRLNNLQGSSDGVNRGEVELAIVWVFNPKVKERAVNFLSQMGKSVRGFVQQESDEEVEDLEEGEEPVENEIAVSAADAEKIQKEKEAVS